MKSRVTTYLLIIYFIAGSILLPLGDFSLMKELPRMYTAYQKIASPEEAGVIDFIGDYLLNGRHLLGHNKNDQPEKQGSAIQFQHAADFAALVAVKHTRPQIIAADNFIDHTAIHLPGNPTDFHSELFRPPLV